MTEYGIFNDEGCVEAGFYSREDAEKARANHADDETTVCEICPDHEEQARETCEECLTDEDDETAPEPIDAYEVERLIDPSGEW